MNVLFIFRRDLRLEDNTALNEALRSGHKVSAVFFVEQELLPIQGFGQLYIFREHECGEAKSQLTKYPPTNLRFQNKCSM